MSHAVWPGVAWVGAWMVLAGAIVAVFGAPAALVRNEWVATLLIVYTGVPIAMVGMLILILGVVGWWLPLGAAVLVGFGWLVRPKAHAK